MGTDRADYLFLLAIASASLALISLFWALILVASLSNNTAVVESFPKDFLHHFLSGWEYWYALVGAFFGLTLAFWIERRKRVAKQTLAIENLKSRVVHNNNLILDMIGFLRNGGISFFKLDPDGLNLWITEAADLLSPALLAEIEAFRHELGHINSKLFTVYSSTEVLAFGRSDAERIQITLGLEARFGIIAHLIAESKRAGKIISMISSGVAS